MHAGLAFATLASLVAADGLGHAWALGPNPQSRRRVLLAIGVAAVLVTALVLV